MGTFIFFVCYIISGIILYLRLFRWYEIDGNEERRIKTPIWALFIYMILFTIPIINIIGIPLFWSVKAWFRDYHDDYVKSIWTKEV